MARFLNSRRATSQIFRSLPCWWLGLERGPELGRSLAVGTLLASGIQLAALSGCGTVLSAGPESFKRTETLLLHLRDKDDILRRDAAAALATRGPEGIMPLTAALDDEEMSVRAQAAQSLARLCEGGKFANLGSLRDTSVVPALLRQTTAPNLQVRLAVAWALGCSGTEAAKRGFFSLRNEVEQTLTQEDSVLADIASYAMRQAQLQGWVVPVTVDEDD